MPKKIKIYSSDKERRHRWCEDCEEKYIGKRKCPICSGVNTGIDEPSIKIRKKIN